MPSGRLPALLLVATIAVSASALVSCKQPVGDPDEAFSPYRIHLGMTPADVRATFAHPTAASSQWRIESTPETMLEWSSAGRSMRFEFHRAQLMAVRAVLPMSDPSTHGAALDVSTATVLRRTMREDGRVELTLLARDCPTHAAEARRLVESR